MPKIKRYVVLEIVLLLGAVLYYLFFVNKGIDLFDEGYFVHSAERVFQGEQPYKDFALQYAPAYFYFLAFLYKIFGPSILVGRFLSLFTCLLIILVTFAILNKLKINSYKIILLSFLSLISFGYPLINIPNIAWMNVLATTVFMLVYVYWISSNNVEQYIFLILMGLLLVLSLSLKQNFGIALIILSVPLIILGKKASLTQIAKNLIIMFGIWFLLTFAWIYFFFLRDNFQFLIQFVGYSRRFALQTAFSYPPLTYIFQPLGIFKLLPYYLPVLLFFVAFVSLFKRNKNIKIVALSFIVVGEFAVSIYPQSDLLHIYPFFGLILVLLLVSLYKSRLSFLSTGIIIVTILTGFYLTLFREYYRYNPPYRFQNTPLNLPRAKGILIQKTTAENLISLSDFINKRTSKNDYIFSYPYYPMIYFILERRNPSKDLIYEIRLWHQYDDKIILNEIKQKKVKYIVTSYGYVFDSDISRFITKQKEVFKNESFKVFEVAILK